jgi:hypothetical protein
LLLILHIIVYFHELTVQNLIESFIIDINVRPIYCGIWQNLDSENQHQSNSRLFRYSYRYGLHWMLHSSESCCCSLIFFIYLCKLDIVSKIDIIIILFLLIWDRTVNVLLVPQLALEKPLHLCVPCS